MSNDMGGGKDEGADARMGMIQINDLVYKLETDLSVAINRTHKTQFFQNQTYTNAQTAIAIVNSGADYIDPRRSFFTFELVIPVTPVMSYVNTFAAGPLRQSASRDFRDAVISCYFGKNGSVLNLIDSVTVSTRSGDELSRISDFGQLQNMIIPEMFGAEWRDSIGQEIGLGSFVGGRNDSTFLDSDNTDARMEGYVRVGTFSSEQRRQKFAIPLYLLSPVFNYGRLLPSMLMSGLRIEIKWKNLDLACQQFWEGVPAQFPADANLNISDAEETEFKQFLGTSTVSGALGALDNTAFPVAETKWAYTAGEGTAGVLQMSGGDNSAFGKVYESSGLRVWNVGDQIVIPLAVGTVFADTATFTITDFPPANDRVVNVSSTWNGGDFTATSPLGTIDGVVVGAWRTVQRRPLPYQRDFGAPAYAGRYTTPSLPLTSYEIKYPEIALCSVQLTDAIQRTLNELSSVNGLEIVYADWDRTSTPVEKSTATPIYTEVRKSASRALMVAARVVRSSPLPHRYDGFASCAGSYWNHWQLQLGSLYFPQQRVDNGNTVAELKHDAVLANSFSYTQDAFDRYHPKAAPTMVSMRGAGIDFNKLYLHPTEVHAEHGPYAYLSPYSAFGKWGSYVNGGTTLGVTLERSTLFDLSGIPINNSRTLALRGEISFGNTADTAGDLSGDFRATLFVFLKYVRLARVFLVNAEVEQ
jgi:hypothetical protein